MLVGGAAAVAAATTGGVLLRPHEGELVTGALDSSYAGRTVRWALALPPGSSGRDLPVCVVLHGKGGDHRMMLGGRGMDLPAVLDRHVRRGGAPFALCSVDGGNRYWHARAAGDDTGRMVSDELVPMLARRGLRTERFAALGWSMGGYGALHLAQRLGSDRVAAVAAVSPALWLRPGDSSRGSFDDREDFVRHDVFRDRSARLAGTAVRVDCGSRDPFLAAARAFAAGLEPHPAGGFEPGGHTERYWRRTAPAQLAFVGRALAGAG